MFNREEVSLWKIQKGTLTMFLAEVVGTVILIFLGCMASIRTMSPILPPQFQQSTVFDKTVNLITMMLGYVNGAHLNPAVIIGAVNVGLESVTTGVIYGIAQFIGATRGYGIFKINLLQDFIGTVDLAMFYAGHNNSGPT